jgi:CRISPR-associated protein Csb2
LFSKHPILLAKVVNDLQLAVVHPPGNSDQHKPERVDPSLRIQNPLSRPPSRITEPVHLHGDSVFGPYAVSLADAEERHALEAETWTRPHTVWSTVTPFVFDRFPKDPFGEEAEEVVRVAFGRIGLPAPCEIDLHYNPWHLGVPKAALFPAAPARAGKPQRYHCHVRVRFEESVAGPMAAGAGRYYGYGFFAPLDESGGRQ